MSFRNAPGVIKTLEPIIVSALGQIIQTEPVITSEVVGEKSTADFLKGKAFPGICVHLQSGGTNNPLMHLLTLPMDFVSNFYAMMIGEEPAEEITDEHLDGLKEGVQQIAGQIKMNLADDQATYALDQVNVFVVEAPDKLSDILTTESGLITNFTIKIDDSVFKLSHFAWGASADEENATQGKDSISVQPAEFGTLKGTSAEMESPRNVDMLMDVDLEVTVELDRKTVMVSELLKLGKGSIVELEKSAGEPLDIYVNGRKFAEGEVVVIDDRFGIRITQLLSPRDRVKSLG